jgi:hypothetical protein
MPHTVAFTRPSSVGVGRPASLWAYLIAATRRLMVDLTARCPMLLKALCPRRESLFAPIFVLGCILITGGIVNAISRDFAPAIGQFNTGEKIGSFSGKEVRMNCGEHGIRIVLGKLNVAGRHLNHVGPTAISTDLRRRAQITPTYFDLLHTNPKTIAG